MRGWLAACACLVFAGLCGEATASEASWLLPAEHFVESDHARLEKLMGALDLERPELAEVRAQWEQGALREACGVLLDYYRRREVAAVLLPKPLEADGSVMTEAGDALEGRFWMQEVLAEVPRRADGGWDWECRGPNRESEWAWFLNRHLFFRDLYGAWYATGQARYAAAISAMVSDWVRANPLPEGLSFSAAWRSLEAARRIEEPWAEVFFGLREERAFAPEARLLMLASVAEHGDYLRHHHARGGNHEITEMMALVLIARAWPEFREASAWLDYAVGRLETALREQTYPDGMHKELANHYQRVAVLSFQRALEWLEGTGEKNHAARMRPRVEAMWEALVGMMRPNGDGPLNNDSDLESTAQFLRERAQPFYQRVDWAWVLSGGQEGECPKGLASRYFPWGGIAVMREDASARSAWAFFDVGPYGSDHQHRDRLHLSISLGEQDYLVDAGRFTYEPGAARAYYQGPRAHNVVLLNGEGTLPGLFVVSEPLPVCAEVGVQRDVFEAQAWYAPALALGKGGAYHRREVVFEKGVPMGRWEVRDELVQVGPACWETLWHFHPDCPVQIENGAVVTTFTDRPNLKLVAVGFAPEWELVKGQKEPWRQGWYSEDYRQEQPATVAIARTRTYAPVVQQWSISFIRPSEEGAAQP